MDYHCSDRRLPFAGCEEGLARREESSLWREASSESGVKEVEELRGAKDW